MGSKREGIEKKPLWVGLVLIVVLFAYLPVGHLFDLCSFTPGNESWRQLVLFIVILLVVHGVITWPVTTFAYRQLSSMGSKLMRLLIVCVLLLPPLFALCYFVATPKDYLDLIEMVFLIVPPLIIAILLYEASENRWLFTGFVAISIFIPIFMINDLFSAFPVARHYITTGWGFYYCRWGFAIVAMVLAVISLWKDNAVAETLEE